MQQKVRVRAQGDDKGVRLSAHLYVSPADIDRVLEGVSRLHASQGLVAGRHHPLYSIRDDDPGRESAKNNKGDAE